MGSESETDALVTGVTEVAAFLWSPMYGRIFQPGIRAQALGRQLSNKERMPLGTWLRVRIAEQDDRGKTFSWVSEALERLPDPPEHLFRRLDDAPNGQMAVSGVGVVGQGTQDGLGLVYSPVLGRVSFSPSILGGKKSPQPLVLVRFDAVAISDRNVEASLDPYVKFKATSLAPYKGPREEMTEACRVKEMRCLGREARVIGEAPMRLGLVAEGEPSLKVVAGEWAVAGGRAALEGLESKAFNVYAVPRPYAEVDVPGRARPCEWEALVVRLSSQPPPPPSPPRLSGRAQSEGESHIFRPMASSASSSGLRSEASALSQPLSGLSLANGGGGGGSDKATMRKVQTELLEAMLEHPDILAILTEDQPRLLARYLSLPD